MRNILVAALILAGTIAMPATAGVNVSIGINLPAYPVLQRVPGYPVYYAPRLNSNYFFYDGLYWVYEGDNWYASDWYNGPWELVDRYEVPVFLLRVPVRYYRSAPVYFRGWRADAPPRWGDHWGSSWHQRRSGWDRWDRRYVPAPAPLPVYQRQYSGSRYPDRTQQAVIQTRSYRYQPRETVVQQRFEQRRASVSDIQRQQQRATREAPRREALRDARRDAQREAARTPAQREAPRRAESRQAAPPPIAMQQGHPPGEAKGWQGADRPPGQAKGWDKERRDEGRRNEGRGNDRRGDDDRGKGKGRDKDKD
jgi:hypothetical protein